MKKLFLAAIILILLSVPCLADMTVILVWDANTESDLAGYTLYRAERIGNMTTAWEKVKSVSEEIITCEDIVEDGKNYAWLVTAFDTTGNESFVSNMAERYDRTPPLSVQNLRKE